MKNYKKKIKPISIIRLVWLIILLIIFVLSVSVIIYEAIDISKYHILVQFLASIIVCICMFEFCMELKKGIIFEENGIVICSDKTLVFHKIQYEVKVNYEEIKDMALLASSNNSKNRPVFGCFVQMPYLLLTCKDDSTQRINLYYYNKKQTIWIIDEIIKRAKRRGNLMEKSSGKDMVSDFLKGKRKL